ncbi:hypothetical protein BDV97DRAFT_364657 [Delphinella strobiligena]|nr:hypothetical protein BDV97DRAFT_364657 [Delphinella strobiligena]
MATNFSEREIKYLAAACRSFKGDPQLDIEKFSGLTNLTTGSARNAWAALRKKMAASTTDDDVATPKPTRKTTTTPKSRAKNIAASSAHKNAGATPTPRSNAKRTMAMTETDDSDDAEVEPSPSKKARSTPAGQSGPSIKRESVEELEDVDGGDEELEELEDNPLFGLSDGIKLESSTPGHHEDGDEV